MKRSLIILAFLPSLICSSQDFKSKFSTLCAATDTAGEIKLLKEWEKTTGTDPDLIIGYYNYYIQRSRTEMLYIDSGPTGKNELELTDSTGKTKGYMSSSSQYDMRYMQQGFDWIDKGIKLYPDRLDMIFGKIYMLGETGNFKDFTSAIVDAVDHSAKIKNAWLWQDGKPQDDPENFFLSSLQDYIVTLSDAGNAQAENMRTISLAVLKYYPDHVESINDVGVSYLIENKYDDALVYFLKAEKLAPKDGVVLSDIAYTYAQKKDTKNAIDYYEKVKQYGDADQKDFAKNKIKELKKGK